jgi:hypothetical protein
MMRFVPYVGVPIAAVVPSALAIAVDPQWSLVFWTLGLYFGVEALVGQFIEPYVYGHNMGLSAIAVVVAAAFWTWVWGPVGLLLSTPLTMCVVVLGRHVDQLRFLDVLLGDRPPLAAEESFYLRMLASDPDETAHQAEMYVRENPLSIYYDEVAMRALMLAQKDASRGALSSERRERILHTIRGLIENLSDREENNASSMEAEPRGRIVFKPSDLAPEWRKTPVLCVAGRGALDEAAAASFAQTPGNPGGRGVVGRCIAQQCAGTRSRWRTGRAGVLSRSGQLQECALSCSPFAQTHSRCGSHCRILGCVRIRFPLSRFRGSHGLRSCGDDLARSGRLHRGARQEGGQPGRTFRSGEDGTCCAAGTGFRELTFHSCIRNAGDFPWTRTLCPAASTRRRAL